MSDPGHPPRDARPAGEPSAPQARVPLWSRVADTLDRANLPLLASALTFDALLTVIPLTILLIVGLGRLLASSSTFGGADPSQLIVGFLPAHVHADPANDPFALVERVLGRIRGYRSHLTLFAVPAFLWFSTRLFGAIRVCLSRVFQVRQRPVHAHFVVSYLLGYLIAKGRDLLMVGVVLALALANTVVSAALALLTAPGVILQPPWTFFVGWVGYLLGEALAVGFALALFVALYRYASPKRLDWSGALLAATVATAGFELAKRLYGLYLSNLAHGGQYSVDANVGAALLFILWLWYMSLVFLSGAAVADVWDRARSARRVAA